MIPKINLTTQKPSVILDTALNDLEAIERTPGYVVDMSTWHSHNTNDNYCHACLAGGVMARITNYDPNTQLFPNQFGEPMYTIFDALDSIRDSNRHEIREGLGNLFDALGTPAADVRHLIIDASELFFDDWVEYETNSRTFKDQRRDLAAFLRHAGY